MLLWAFYSHDLVKLSLVNSFGSIYLRSYDFMLTRKGRDGMGQLLVRGDANI